MEAEKVVVITGASSGIGLECAKTFFKAGYRVLIASRNEEAMRDIQRSLDSSGKRLAYCVTDVSREDDCRKMVENTISQLGRIDVLICNAGVTMRALFSDVKISVLRELMEINFWGSVYCIKFALPHLLASKGVVAGMSTVAGYKGLPTRAGYSASKFALEGFLESLRIEHLNSGLHVLTIRPGFTASNIRNTARSGDGSYQGKSHKNEANMMQPDVVAREVLKAVERRKRSIVLTPVARLLLWVNKLFPAWADRLVHKYIAAEKDSTLR